MTPHRRDRSSRIHALVAASAAVAAVTVGLGSASAQASDDTTDIVGLGDSYAAGVGGGDYDPASEGCQRSPYGYASQVAARVGAGLTFVACSGATTSNVLESQVSSLSADTDVVTLTVGGNDVGFVPVLTECAQPAWSGNCMGKIDEADAKIRNELPGSLDDVYAEIAERSPEATVVVSGYPHLFMGEDCSPVTFFGPDEQERLNATADLLDETIAAKAAEYGFTYVDPRDAFAGHALCDDDAWIHNFKVDPMSDSFHPTVSGHTAYADLVDDYVA